MVESLQGKPVADSISAVSTNQNAESGSTSVEPVVITPQAGVELLRRLARQVEYYFSTTNLATDTYVTTLRSLNDGYVPISIIANFGKVRSLVPYDALNAVHQASEEHSDLLEVVFIDTKTGKRALPGGQSTALVAAVGPKSGEPIPASKLTPMPSPVNATNVMPNPAANRVQNTVVLREVPQGVEEAQVRQLFAFDKCPAIQDLHRDVANCWFVTLDTTSRDVMLDVMFALREKKFESGEPVMARLKSAVAANRDAVTNVAYLSGSPIMAPHSDSFEGRTGGRKNKKKSNSKKARSNNRNGSTQTKNANGKKNNGTGNKGGKQKKPNGQDQPQHQKQSSKSNPSDNTRPPSFGEEQFPALPSDDGMSSEKFRVEKVPEHDELGKKNSGTSDSSSTATTSTSSSKTPQPHSVAGGYAAALLKKAAPKDITNSSNSKQGEKKTPAAKKALPKEDAEPRQTSASDSKAAPTTDRPESPKVNVPPPSWGRGTFADILRSKETSMATART